jgi:protein-S-isoprenylcysteine O-methyltransferase
MERALAIPDLMLIQPVRFHLLDLRPHPENIERGERSACTPLFAGNRDAMPNPLVLAAIYGLSELYLALTRRSRTQTISRDRRSLMLLWTIIIVSLWLGIQIVWLFPNATVRYLREFYLAGFLLFLGGLILRWYSIGYLGRYFTVDVSISAEHKLIDSGPYRYIRHPTYTGALLAFLGLGFCFGNWLSISFMTVPIIAAFLWRIQIEEHALIDALGEEYRAYTQRTKRLIPFVY